MMSGVMVRSSWAICVYGQSSSKYSNMICSVAQKQPNP